MMDLVDATELVEAAVDNLVGWHEASIRGPRLPHLVGSVLVGQPDPRAVDLLHRHPAPAPGRSAGPRRGPRRVGRPTSTTLGAGSRPSAPASPTSTWPPQGPAWRCVPEACGTPARPMARRPRPRRPTHPPTWWSNPWWTPTTLAEFELATCAAFGGLAPITPGDIHAPGILADPAMHVLVGRRDDAGGGRRHGLRGRRGERALRRGHGAR